MHTHLDGHTLARGVRRQFPLLPARAVIYLPLIYNVKTPARLNAPEAMKAPAVEAAKGVQAVGARREVDIGCCGGGGGGQHQHQSQRHGPGTAAGPHLHSQDACGLDRRGVE